MKILDFWPWPAVEKLFPRAPLAPRYSLMEHQQRHCISRGTCSVAVLPTPVCVSFAHCVGGVSAAWRTYGTFKRRLGGQRHRRSDHQRVPNIFAADRRSVAAPPFCVAPIVVSRLFPTNLAPHLEYQPHCHVMETHNVRTKYRIVRANAEVWKISDAAVIYRRWIFRPGKLHSLRRHTAGAHLPYKMATETT